MVYKQKTGFEKKTLFVTTFFQGDTTESERQNIVAEVKEEMIDDDALSVQKIQYSEAGENNTVFDV